MVSPIALLPPASAGHTGLPRPFLVEARQPPLPAVLQEIPAESKDVEALIPDVVSEKLNAELPGVSCCIEEARKALSEKRIEDLCSHLEKASAILQQVIVALIPDAVMEAPAEEAAPVEAAQEEEPLVMALAA